ncbi:TonB-dependent receptor [Paludibacter sp.]
MAQLAYSQDRSISGYVKDANNEPLIGASIVVKGSSRGTITDMDGKFTISVPTANKEAQLEVSYIGYNTQTIVVTNQTVLNVVLKENEEMLDEVVVVGYGQMQKSDLTGSLSSVKINDAEASSSLNLQSLIQGRASGVQITEGDGAPGSAINMKIRGTSSLNLLGEPLYVIDGIIMNSTMDQNAGGEDASNFQSSAQDGLAGINPQDIKSFEILKDASATAIFGSLGANGVVLITTKSGSTEKPKIQYQGSLTTAHLANKREMLNLEQYAEIRSITKNIEIPTNDKTYIDWQDWATRQAWSYNHRVNVSGKTDKTVYYISGGFSSNEGILKQTDAQQSTFRLNLDQDVTPNIKIGTKSSFSYQRLNMTQSSSAASTSGLVRQMTLFFPYKPLGTDDETGDEGDDVFGPMPWLSDFVDYTDVYRTLSSFYVNVKLNKRLSMRTTLGMDYRTRTRKRFYGNKTWYGKQENGYISVSSQEATRFNIDHMFTYMYKQNKHRINATAGVSFIESIVKDHLVEGKQFSTFAFRENGLMYSNNPIPPLYLEGQTDIFSALARVIYNYDERFVLTSTFRADGTSKFAPGNKFSYFPSFAGAYRLDQEDFMQSVELISNAKLRLGWGLVGNQAISNYQTLSQYSNGMYINSSGSGYYNAYIISNMSNPDLRWETTNQYNLGLDLGMMMNRLNFTVDVYNKRSYDLLQNIELGLSSGYSTMSINRGEILNQGLEVSVDYFPIKSKKMSLNISGNISFNRNKIVNIGLPVSTFGSNEWAAFLGRDIANAAYFKSPANIFIEGQPVALFYGIKVDGIVTQEEQDLDRATRTANYLALNPGADPITEANLITVEGTLPLWNNGFLLQAGDPRYVDVDGDGNIDVELDKTILGDPNPDFTYGFTLDFNYRNFYVSAVFSGVYGNEIVNSNRMIEEDITTQGNIYNLTKKVYDNYWRSDRISTTYPRLLYTGNAGTFTNFIIEDGSFLRFSNLTVGYTHYLRDNKFISSVGISLMGRNLFVLTKYSGYDPEVRSFATDPLRVGIDYSSYPKSRSYAVGVTVDF